MAHEQSLLNANKAVEPAARLNHQNNQQLDRVLRSTRVSRKRARSTGEASDGNATDDGEAPAIDQAAQGNARKLRARTCLKTICTKVDDDDDDDEGTNQQAAQIGNDGAHRAKRARLSPSDLLSVDDGAMSIILSNLNHTDKKSLSLTCWALAQQVVRAPKNAKPLVSVTTTASQKLNKNLLTGIKRQDVKLKAAGSASQIVQQLTAMETVAGCIATVNLHLDARYKDNNDKHGIAVQLSHALAPLRNYNNLTRLELAVTPRRFSGGANAIQPLRGMPAIKELVLLEGNCLPIGILVDTLCATAVPMWQHSIRKLTVLAHRNMQSVIFELLDIFQKQSQWLSGLRSTPGICLNVATISLPQVRGRDFIGDVPGAH